MNTKALIYGVITYLLLHVANMGFSAVFVGYAANNGLLSLLWVVNILLLVPMAVSGYITGRMARTNSLKHGAIVGGLGGIAIVAVPYIFWPYNLSVSLWGITIGRVVLSIVVCGLSARVGQLHSTSRSGHAVTPTSLLQSLPVKYGIISAALGFLVVMGLLIGAIFRSTSSTAGIGLFFASFIAALYASVFFVFGYCAGRVRASLKTSGKHFQLRTLIPGIIAISLGGYGVWWLAHGMFLVYETQRLQHINSQQITQYFNDAKPTDKFILGAIAQNEFTPPVVLDTVAHSNDVALHKRMENVLPVMGENKRGLAVMRLIAKHPQVRPDTLEYLAHTSSDSYVLGDVVANQKVSTATIERVYRNREQYDHGGQLITWGVARNPHTPGPILGEIAKSGDQYARGSVAENPNISEGDLALLSSDDVWHVRRSVVSNTRVTKSLLEKLGQDSDSRVSTVAKHKLTNFNQ